MKKITTDALRRLYYTEGLILQAGTGGDPDKFAAVIHDLLTKEGVLLESDAFKDVSVFEYDGKDHLYFSLEKVKLDWNQLNLWRLQSQGFFHGEWLSDFVPNRLGDFVVEKEQPCQNKNESPNAIASKIADFIVKDSSLNTTQGNYIHYYGVIAKQFGIDEKDIDLMKGEIESELYEHQEVTDVYLEPDGGFDVCYYLAYCPNHDDSDYEPEEAVSSDESEDQGMGGIT